MGHPTFQTKLHYQPADPSSQANFLFVSYYNETYEKSSCPGHLGLTDDYYSFLILLNLTVSFIERAYCLLITILSNLVSIQQQDKLSLPPTVLQKDSAKFPYWGLFNYSDSLYIKISPIFYIANPNRDPTGPSTPQYENYPKIHNITYTAINKNKFVFIVKDVLCRTLYINLCRTCSEV